jgi:hypothetical protein
MAQTKSGSANIGLKCEALIFTAVEKSFLRER